ncbi:MAG: cobalt ECF transporter T component CbiQ [Phycisphaerales bacterium]|nr:cobalt ECF transporter T component CbiQ [Phycisphaerales bacterium]
MHHHYIDRFSYQDSPIHNLDPRAKILAVLAYSILLISYPRYTLPAPWFVVFPAALLLWGRIPLRFVFKHILLVSPFIFCMVIFTVLFDKTPVAVGRHVVPGGWLTAASVLTRFALGMGALIGLVSTTRFADLLKGLEKLRVPHLLVSQLRFLYRYLFLLIDQVMHLRQARQARDAGLGPRAQRWRSSAGMIGTLFVRTLDQAERTHLAMLARGYDGTIRLAHPLHWRKADSLFILLTLVYLVFARWG